MSTVTNAVSETEQNYQSKVNRIMSWVLLAHLPVAIGLAYSFNTNVIFAIVASLIISSLPIFLTYFSKQIKLASITYAIALISFSGLMIHLSRGMIEAHFHIFVSLASLIIYADPYVILAAAATAAVHHISFFFLFPQSVFNYKATFGIVVVHAVFVVLETVPCLWISNKFKQYVINQGIVLKKVDELSNHMREMIKELNVDNVQLNTKFDFQSSAVTQTAQAIVEISEMANQTASNANNSMNKSVENKKAAEEGNFAADEMARSIEKIKNSNEKLLNQINASNIELNSIVEIIKQVENKAKVIDEIVFQTKLLSFNASVEAARAGEQGKGFAVVAEEVGNLAKMSGEASREIKTLITTSVQKVENVASETEVKVKELVTLSQKSIDEGTSKGHELKGKLVNIMNQVSEVNSNLVEISSASKEQSSGITELNRVITELEQVNIENNQTLKHATTASNKLSELADDLTTLVDELSKAS